MGLFGGIVDAIFGGEDDTAVTTTTTQESSVTVEVNPSIGISNVVDLSPVERALAEMARVVDRGQQASAAATAATGQGLQQLAAAEAARQAQLGEIEAARQAQLGQLVADAKAGLVQLGHELDARVSDAGQVVVVIAAAGLFIWWQRGQHGRR